MLRYEDYLDVVNHALQTLPMLEGNGEEFEADQILKSSLEAKPPQPLRAAMRYSLLLGGKRVRAVLLLMSYQLLKENWKDVLPYACALEMIHTYSLIHDDLPALDNDDVRRGHPSNHVVFGENIAILAGDGLLNLAYETMLSCDYTRLNPGIALSAISEIAQRAGVCGMIAGQTLDVKLEGTKPCKQAVEYIHQHKTADLLTAPVLGGLILAGANKEEIAAGEKFGHNLGLCFQIVDDLLDLQGDEHILGKKIHKDAVIGKQTWPEVFGVEASRKKAAELANEAVEALSMFGEAANPMCDLTLGLVNRQH